MKQYEKAALKSMGYRPIAPDQSKWAKPIGTNLLVFQDDCLQLLFYRADNGEAQGWNSIDIDQSKIPESRPDFFGSALRVAEHEILGDGLKVLSMRNFAFLSAEETVLLELS